MNSAPVKSSNGSSSADVLSDPYFALDMVSVSLSLGSLFLYHLYIFAMVKVRPHLTVMGLNNEFRKAWVRFIMHGTSTPILAVQVLRNTIYGASLIATTSITIAIGVVAFSQSIAFISSRLTMLGSKNELLLFIKIILASAFCLSSFFNLTLSVRSINHATFLMMLPKTDREIHHESNEKLVFPVDVQIAVNTLNKGYLHYSLGMRSLYFMVPVASWIFGPLFMLIATALILLLLFFLDHANVRSPLNLTSFGQQIGDDRETGSNNQIELEKIQ